MRSSVTPGQMLIAAGCLLLVACALPTDSGQLRQITVLYTNDEHGWMEGMEPQQGAARLYALWQEREGYEPDGPFLVLSGGDNWTGPAISTWTEGESMVQVMNAMQYDASAVGNHEFDFGLDVLSQRSIEADYPYLSANTRWRDNDAVPVENGILPFAIETVNDVRFGIVGLTTRDTPFATNPVNVARLNFIDYERALRETIPAVRAQGVDLLLVIAHVCVAELEPLIRATRDLDIAMMGAGHCNELTARRVGSTVLLGGGFHFSAYARATFTYDLAARQLVRTRFSASEFRREIPNPDIEQLVSSWAEESAAFLSQPVAYLENTVTRRSPALEQAIVESWLQMDPLADIAITNAGGVRTDLAAGLVNVGALVALLPFDNTIIATEIDGATVRRALAEGIRPIVGGLERRGNQWILKNSGAALQDNLRYRVLINSFMYAGGDNYIMFAEADPDSFDTGINYRQPFQDWLQAQGSSAQHPLRL